MLLNNVRQFYLLSPQRVGKKRIADFIELRLRRHPIMIRLIMRIFDYWPRQIQHGAKARPDCWLRD